MSHTATTKSINRPPRGTKARHRAAAPSAHARPPATVVRFARPRSRVLLRTVRAG